ncbi:electron transfer flavoprotein subunit beta/FixA family protein [Phytohabitans sp. ZYX-F-186]|uniref:Electron transfer flavoprotein subunit beta n=1 Tax=Phytohabitans maris TaxID=3071409 RepID=A0ABU0ZNE9_9ACTN|nr:electron transfer flavoprotein subunit beta/FixA family protein [Phytohabitans sp. ZYX-F-186]MDQ7908561.1 electron transfer flavoprotein subunit beta/FixA family protein [Phytohabitans sp. ZYX-F-186]
MRTVVLAKYVPDATADRRFDPADHTTVRDDIESRLSELDEYAVEQAVRLSEQSGGEVLVVLMGPGGAADAALRALQMGATAAVHVRDAALRGTDAAGTALVLAAAVGRAGGADLVLTGMASTDAGTGLVPAMVAHRLGLPFVGYVDELDVAGGTATGARETEAFRERFEVALPAVVAVTDHINEPRYPSFKAIMAAKKKPVEVIALTDLGIAPDEVGFAGARTAVESALRRPARSSGEVVKDDGDGGARMVAYLVDNRLI